MIHFKGSMLDNKSVYDRVRSDMRKLDNSYTKVGFPAEADVGSPTKKGSHKPASDISEIAEIAIKNEFGVSEGGRWKIPPRPFFRNAIDTNRAAFNSFRNRQYENTLAGLIDVDQAIGNIGEWLAAKVKRSIVRLRTPPNAPATIARKGSSNPLIDTGQMRQSVTHADKIGGGKSSSKGKESIKIFAK